ncbi:MAG: hypothetical protein ABI353_00975 [Isosphaeraceae bacterium]
MSDKANYDELIRKAASIANQPYSINTYHDIDHLLAYIDDLHDSRMLSETQLIQLRSILLEPAR